VILDYSPFTCFISGAALKGSPKFCPNCGDRQLLNAPVAPDARPVCRYGSQCYRTKPEHIREYQHPGSAGAAAAAAPDRRPHCRYGTKCTRKNLEHKQQYQHTQKPAPAKSTPCKYHAGCFRTNSHHFSRYSHPPLLPPTVVYHQTDEASASAILSSQSFNPGSAGECGAAIYFAENERDTNHKAWRRGVILKATVRMGRVKTVDPSGNSSLTRQSLEAEGFDSVKFLSAGGTEYVVYNPKRITKIERL
jgi:hypothetical protein